MSLKFEESTIKKPVDGLDPKEFFDGPKIHQELANLGELKGGTGGKSITMTPQMKELFDAPTGGKSSDSSPEVNKTFEDLQKSAP